MSKSRVPRLPAGSNRSTIQAYVKDVRKYAQVEFERGTTESEVYQNVNREGVTLPALRSVISGEYLKFIGVTDGQMKMTKGIATLCAVAFYWFASSHIVSDSALQRNAIPLFLAIFLYVGAQNLGTLLWKQFKKPKAS